MTRKNVLVVDDSKFDRELLIQALGKKTNFEMREAENVQQCLDLIDGSSIDLILMDIMMPDVLGSDALVQIRERFNPIELPIIMVTSKNESSDVVGCLREGANDYITKPVNFQVAISRILTHLSLAELSTEMAKMREISALDAMITTYNHEINNPLAIALGCLSSARLNDKENIERLKTALWRVADIVKKIDRINDQKEVEYGDYSNTSKMIKLG